MTTKKKKKKDRRSPETRLRAIEATLHTLEVVVALDGKRYPLPDGVDEGGFALTCLAQDLGIETKDVPAFKGWLRTRFFIDTERERT